MMYIIYNYGEKLIGVHLLRHSVMKVVRSLKPLKLYNRTKIKRT